MQIIATDLKKVSFSFKTEKISYIDTVYCLPSWFFSAIFLSALSGSHLDEVVRYYRNKPETLSLKDTTHFFKLGLEVIEEEKMMFLNRSKRGKEFEICADLSKPRGEKSAEAEKSIQGKTFVHDWLVAITGKANATLSCC